MGFFEEIADKAKNAAQIVGKNAGNLVDTSKLKLHAADLKSDINKNYEALGKLVYESQKNQTDAAGAIGEGVAAIDELYEQLEAVEAQLLKLSNKTICPKCGEKMHERMPVLPQVRRKAGAGRGKRKTGGLRLRLRSRGREAGRFLRVRQWLRLRIGRRKKISCF